MGTVDSDAIAKIGFSGSPGMRGVLRIEFKDGAVAEYEGVHWNRAKRFIFAQSHGQYYNQYIRGKAVAKKS